MPRFTGQNKKRINPRYFLDETRLNEQDIDNMTDIQQQEYLRDIDDCAQKLRNTADSDKEGKMDWDQVSGCRQSLFDGENLTEFGKRVEARANELYTKNPPKISKSGSTSVQGRLNAVDKVLNQTPKVSRTTGRQLPR